VIFEIPGVKENKIKKNSQKFPKINPFLSGSDWI
jgi:hypothetical protein